MLRRFLELPPYRPIEPPEEIARRLKIPPEEIIKLDGNENPYGCSPRVKKALKNLKNIHIYPDPLHRRLKKALSEYTGMEEEYIIAGAGSDEILELITRLFVEEGDKVAIFTPTFGMYPFLAKLYGGKLVEAGRKDDFSIDPNSLKEKVKLIFIASPNNPTGNTISEKELLPLLEKAEFIVIDEAYYEFSGETFINLIPKIKKLGVVRSFSKWAGIASLRVGYGIFPKDITETLYKIKQPYNVNLAGEVAAIASLEDRELLMKRVRMIIRERERAYKKLGELGLKPYPSKANFILCETKRAREIKEELLKRGILIRYFEGRGLEDKIRVSIGRRRDMDRLYKALEEIL